MKKIVYLAILLCTVLFMAIPSQALSLTDGAVNVHDELCDHEHEQTNSSDELNGIVTPMGDCWLGHWFTTTEYRTGGACYVKYNQSNGTNYQCYIVVYKVVTCNNCGAQVSHEEYSRTYGACIFLENH